MIWRYVLSCVLLTSITSCSGIPPLENSTMRRKIIGNRDVRAGLNLNIMPNEEVCRSIIMGATGKYDTTEFDSFDEQLTTCLPHVNRMTGEISLSFALIPIGQSTPLRLPLDAADVTLNHSGWSSGGDGEPGGYYTKAFSSTSAEQRDQADIEVKFEAHDDVTAGQLFVVLVDHSASMGEMATDPKTKTTKSRMEWVKDALRTAKDVFIKGESKDEAGQTVPASAVALLRFGGKQGNGRDPGPGALTLQGMNGESWRQVRPILTKQAYEAQIKKLGARLGWTHLYHVLEVAVTELVMGKTYLANFLKKYDKVMPTIIVLTDGFNNTYQSQKCKDNAGPLSELLKTIEASRGSKGSLNQRPTVYTVGFGQALPIPDIVQTSTDVDELDLCGSHGDQQISAGRRVKGLEQTNIDGGSLQLIANFGGGKAYVDPDPAKLKEAFLNAAPPRYRWYTYRYRVKSTEMRSPFMTEIVLNRFAAASAKVVWYPSPWIDGPSGTPLYEKPKKGGDPWKPTGWSTSSSVRHATGLLLLLLGILMTLSFLGPAIFNGRRAVTRRSRKTS